MPAIRSTAAMIAAAFRPRLGDARLVTFGASAIGGVGFGPKAGRGELCKGGIGWTFDGHAQALCDRRPDIGHATEDRGQICTRGEDRCSVSTRPARRLIGSVGRVEDSRRL